MSAAFAIGPGYPLRFFEGGLLVNECIFLMISITPLISIGKMKKLCPEDVLVLVYYTATELGIHSRNAYKWCSVISKPGCLSARPNRTALLQWTLDWNTYAYADVQTKEHVTKPTSINTSIV